MKLAIRPAGRRDDAPRSGEWWPALDGLRGLAVAAVLLYHHDPSRVRGGFLGVSLFFTVSGFLITRLLLREHTGSGRIDIRRFWVRRARRLAPIALLGLLLAAAVGWFTRSPEALGPIAGDVRAAALNLANWRQLGSGLTYGDAFAPPSPVTHYWSLAIEEQFYLVFPLLAAVALRRGRHWLVGLLVAATMASFVAQLAADTANRAYLGTDTRLAELAIGALLAVLLSARRWELPARLVDLAGFAALSALAAAWVRVPLESGALFKGGLLLHALAAAVVVLGAVHGDAVRRALSWGPLVGLGLVSYGVYVVHFPLYLLLDANRTGVDGASLLVLRLAATITLAVLLHHLVENPVRWGGALPGWEGGVAFASGLGVVLLLATAIPHVGRADARDGELAIARDSVTVITMPPPPDAAPVERFDPPAPADTTSTTAMAGGSDEKAPVGVPGPDGGEPPAVSARPVRLLVVGDSTAYAGGTGMQQWATATRAASVDVVMASACTFKSDGVAIVRSGWVWTPTEECRRLLATARQVAATQHPDALLVFIGSFQLADWQAPGDPVPRAVGDPTFDASYMAAAHDALTELETLGVPVLLATLPTPAWDPTAQWDAATIPGEGPVTMNDAGRARRFNDLNASVVASHPLVRLVPYAEFISEPDGSVSNALRPDGLHVNPASLAALMPRGLEAIFRDGYRSVSASPGAVREAGPTVWDP